MQQPVDHSAQQARLFNGHQELVALGDCEFQADGAITMRVAEEHVAQPHLRTTDLLLVLDDGQSITVSERFVRLQIRGNEGRLNTIYRLHAVHD